MDEKPKHIAIIPDGNRRWGKLHGISKKEAYAKGIAKIEDVAEWHRETGIKMLTMWGFSTENFSRDRNEIGELFDLFKKNLLSSIRSDKKEKKRIRVRFFGRLSLFPTEIQKLIEKVEKDTEENDEYQLNLLLSYGGRNEIIDAVNSVLKSGIKKVDEKTLSEHMYTAGLPDPDLIIRTSGAQRLSGLLPWQSVYSELYFCEKLWPDFSKDDFHKALEFYKNTKRKFGK